MDSDTSDDMASGSKARDRGLRGDKVPLWKEVNKATFADWWYDFDSYCATNGLERTVNGDDRGEKLSIDDQKRYKYEKKSRKLWRAIMSAISGETVNGKALKLMIRNDFKDDKHDGFALAEHLKRWANHQTHTHIEKLLTKIADLSFKKSESPNRWNLKMQQALETWEMIPEARRGGGIEHLVEKLLKKVGEVERNYINWVRISAS